MFMVITMYKTMKSQYFMVYRMYTRLMEIILYFIFVTGKEKDHVLWVYAGSPEPIKPEDVPEFLK